jgi:hypothetical protein
MPTEPNAMTSIQILLYEPDLAAFQRCLGALAATVQAATEQAATGQASWGAVAVRLGDCSARPALGPAVLDRWRAALPPAAKVATSYTFFGENLGFARGHNRLWREGPREGRLLILNPDALPAPHLLARLGALADARPGWAAIEARQIPIEHPKPFDPATWEAAWVSGACTLLDGAAFEAVGGFDEQFFMYGEDVDLSWRLRARGRRLYFCPETFVYHAKRLAGRQPAVSAAETHHGPLALMLLRAKYGRDDLNARILELLRADPRPECARTLADYDRLRVALTPASDAERAVASFAPDGGLADLRWAYPLPGTMLVAS